MVSPYWENRRKEDSELDDFKKSARDLGYEVGTFVAVDDGGEEDG